MDSVTIIVEGLRIVLGFLALVFIPGLAVSLVFFPRFTDMGLFQRLAWSTVLSIGAILASVLFLDVVLGVPANPQNISLGLGLFSAILFVVWFCEVWYLISSIPAKLHRSFGFLGPWKYLSRIVNSWTDRFTRTEMTRVIWHESQRTGENHVDHSYLIDIREAIDIHQVDETKGKVSEPSLVPPPYPRTWYFELVIREFRDGDISLIDDLQIYPVQVTRKPDLAIMGFSILRGGLKIRERIYKKTDGMEIQWIYSHDFHLFAILYSQDTVVQMVDRVLLKLDEIATSIRKGSRVSSHLEETQKLKDEFEGVLEKPRTTAPTITEEPVVYGTGRTFTKPVETDRRDLQAGIVRDLRVRHITPENFRRSDRMILDIKIPENLGVTRILESIHDLQDDDWLYE